MRNNENGRSMIEMLGVLAIIGVLSVGGIYGYTIAMRKYKANEIVQTASMLATMAHAANAGAGDTITLANSGLGTTPGAVTVDMCANTPSGSVTEVKIQITAANGNTTDANHANGILCDAVTSIAPTAAGTAATRSGYYVSCGIGAVTCS